MAKITSITVFQDQTDMVKSKATKAGESHTYMSKKDYSVKFGLKGAELRRAHDQYRFDFGMSGNKALSAAIASGEIVVQKVADTKNGFNASFVRKSVLELEADPVAVAGQLTIEQLQAVLAAKQAQPQASQPALEV